MASEEFQQLQRWSRDERPLQTETMFKGGVTQGGAIQFQECTHTDSGVVRTSWTCPCSHHSRHHRCACELDSTVESSCVNQQHEIKKGGRAQSAKGLGCPAKALGFHSAHARALEWARDKGQNFRELDLPIPVV